MAQWGLYMTRRRITNKTVCGVGINDADYAVTLRESATSNKIIWGCPYWEKWRSMLKRCYLKSYHINNPTYKGCSVCDEWLTFSNFKSWMEQQDWEGKQLDKDLLVYQNKVYSPETCVFISAKLNMFLCVNQNKNQQHKIGVWRSHKPQWNIKEYMCKIQNGTGRQEYVGVFCTEQEAHRAWQIRKRELGIELLKEQTNIKVIKGLCRIINKLHYDAVNGITTYSL